MSRTTLARLVGSDLEGFADAVWGNQPLHVPGDPVRSGTWADLLTLDGVDELIALRGLRIPFMRMARAGETLAERRFTTGGGVGAAVRDQISDDAVHREFAAGATIVLQGLHRVWPPVIDFAQDLAGDLGHPVQVNAYITPPQSQGFSAHYDVHDVFVLQLAGRKRWAVHEPVHCWPLRDQPWDRRREAVARRAAEDEPVLAAELEPGDCLYVPRGFIHSAVALGEISAHLTVGVHTWTAHTVAQSVATAAQQVLADTADGRRPLPVGVDVTDPDAMRTVAEQARARLVRAVQELDLEAVLGGLAGQATGAQRAEPLRPLAQEVAARSADLTARYRVRRHLGLRLDTPSGGALRVRGRGVDLLVPEPEAAIARAALTREEDFTATELATAAGSDDDAALPALRRLVGARIVVPAGAPRAR